MKLSISVLMSVLLFWGCKKSIDETPVSGGFPGSLDSVAVSLHDSGIFTGASSFLKFSYDNQRRVVKENAGGLTGGVVRTYDYNGNDLLPYRQTDSSVSSGGSYSYLYKHLFTYDGNKRVIRDSINYYERYTSNNSINTTSIRNYSIRYQYQSNYMLEINSSNTTCAGTDTLFFNTNGDIQKKHYRCYSSENKTDVEEYFPDRNPLSDLNIAPLFSSRGAFWFAIEIHPVVYNVFQSRSFVKTLSGTNSTYYSHNPDDFVKVLFYRDLDANNKIKDLVLVHYTYYHNYTGNHVEKFYVNYRFFYH